jgi:hypothetical protein
MGRKVELNGATPSPLVGVSTLVPDDQEAVKAWPNLMQCILPQWKEGKCTRQAGTLRLKVTGAWFILTLSCPTEGVEAELTTHTLVGILDALEEILRNGKAVWKPTWDAVKKTRQVRVR